MAEIYNIYCDESCHLPNDQSEVMVLGCVWCAADRVPEIAVRLREIKQDAGLRASEGHVNVGTFELKWSRVSKGGLKYYRDVVDYFFDDDDLHYRCLVVPKKRELFRSGEASESDLWYYRLCFLLFEPLIDPRHKYRIYLDIKDTQNEHRRRGLQESLRTARGDSKQSIVERIQQMRSHESEVLQLADFLTGAVRYANAGLNGSAAKVELLKRIERRLGRPLDDATWMRDPKMSIHRVQRVGGVI